MSAHPRASIARRLSSFFIPSFIHSLTHLFRIILDYPSSTFAILVSPLPHDTIIYTLLFWTIANIVSAFFNVLSGCESSTSNRAYETSLLLYLIPLVSLLFSGLLYPVLPIKFSVQRPGAESLRYTILPLPLNQSTSRGRETIFPPHQTQPPAFGENAIDASSHPQRSGRGRIGSQPRNKPCPQRVRSLPERAEKDREALLGARA
jgi:hypothetical protein